MAKWNIGEKNGFWKGGKTITNHGYILRRVGTSHHLSDVRGYAYEHRIIAEEKIGRKLRKREIVHHINGNKQDNRQENLEVLIGNSEHFYNHRKENCNLQKPRQKNYFIKCKCNCGKRILKFDKSGRPRNFISGHNSYGRKN